LIIGKAKKLNDERIRDAAEPALLHFPKERYGTNNIKNINEAEYIFYMIFKKAYV